MGVLPRVVAAALASLIVLSACLAAPAPAQAPSSPSPSVAPTGRVAPDVANRALADLARDTGRTGVAICIYVDPSTGLNADAARAALQGSVDALVQQGYSVFGAQRVAQCPQAPVFLRTNTVHPKNSCCGTVGTAPRVTSPSPFLLFLAVTTPARIATIFGGLTLRRGAEEITCTGDNCGEVTGSIYVEPAAFGRAADREKSILEGLGLLAVQ